jgi:Fur family ferric uptake transcriptional regulator
MRVPSSAQQLLAERGIRTTRQRVRVLEALLAEPNDATAQDIHESLRAQREPICGEGHHHHLTCTGCHQVVELGECELEPWLARLGGTHGFTVTNHAVEVTGICAACAS